MNNFVWNISSLPAPSPVVPAVSNNSPEGDEHPPPLVPIRPGEISSQPPEAAERLQHNPISTTASPSSNHKLTPSFIQALCLNSSMSSFIGPLESSVPNGDSPSYRLQRSCPICFPAHRPTGFDR